jgi:hypothetical protein
MTKEAVKRYIENALLLVIGFFLRLLNDFVMTDGLADHRIPPHVCSAVGVNVTPEGG